MASPHLAEQVGRVLDGRYRVVAPIGTGASAAVYLADDTTLRRRVAIKVLHAALATDQGFLKRFQAEARTAAALSHPNVMRVLDWGEADDGPLLVLEYLGGGSLRSVLDQESKLSVAQAVQIGIQAARALDYAHRRGLVHRDVKPANLLFDEEGRLAIADFGLARALAEAAWTEPGGAVLGTARYASPEQVRGYSLDGKSDVYALGLVLFEAVCGFVPFTADTTIATLMARLDAKLEIPEELGALGTVVEQATQTDPAQRITASELVELLEQRAATLPAPAHITLPGAIAVDVRATSGDPTLLPRPGDNMPTVSVEARPLPKEMKPKTKRRLFKRNKAEKIEKVDIRAQVTKPAKVKKSHKKLVRRLLFAVFLTVIVAGSGAAGYALYYNTGRELAVPQLEGMTLDDARAAAKAAEIKLAFDGTVFDETIPAGTTIQQDPQVGGSVHLRQEVHIKVSKGPAPRAVVDVKGQNVEAAKNALAEKGFVVETENRFSETAALGTVLEQNPATGELDKGTTVKLVLSGGPEPRVIPDLVGKTYEEALAMLAAKQLKVTRSEAFDNEVPVGQVMGTTPSVGRSAARDSIVTVIVSKGPDLVTVADVTGMSQNGATAKLQADGFTVNSFGDGGTVFTTKPAAGEKAKRGTIVKIFID